MGKFNKEVDHLYSPPSDIRVIKSKKDEMDGVWEKKKNAVLVWKPERKNHMVDLSLEFRAVLRRTSR